MDNNKTVSSVFSIHFANVVVCVTRRLLMLFQRVTLVFHILVQKGSGIPQNDIIISVKDIIIYQADYTQWVLYMHFWVN